MFEPAKIGLCYSYHFKKGGKVGDSRLTRYLFKVAGLIPSLRAKRNGQVAVALATSLAASWHALPLSAARSSEQRYSLAGRTETAAAFALVNRARWLILILLWARQASEARCRSCHWRRSLSCFDGLSRQRCNLGRGHPRRSSLHPSSDSWWPIGTESRLRMPGCASFGCLSCRWRKVSLEIVAVTGPDSP